MYMCAIPQSKKMGKIFVFSMFEQHIRTQSISEIAGRVARKMALASYEGTRTLWDHLMCGLQIRARGHCGAISFIAHISLGHRARAPYPHCFT